MYILYPYRFKRAPIKLSGHIAALIFLFVLILSGTAFSYPKYDEILRKAEKINSGLNSLKVPIKIKTRVVGIMIPLDGILYYKKPDKIHLSIPRVPGILKRKKSWFSEAVPKSFNPDDYTGSVITTETLDGGSECYILNLIPKKDCKIKNAQLWVDSKTWISPKTIIYYKDGSCITSLQNYRREKNYILPDKQYILFKFPELKLEAAVSYNKYELNAPVSIP